MAELPDALKSLTVKALRDLARKQLGAGYSRLKTKSQLVAALARGLDGAAARGLVAKLTGRKPAQEKAPGRAGSKTAPVPPRPAAAPREREGRAPKAAAKGSTATEGRTASSPPARTASPAPPRAPSSVAYDERLGELPDRYYDDSFVALAVDPQTLFLYWDHAEGTVRAAAASLASPRAVLSVHSGGERVREVDFALESRAFYVRGLPPGRSYHAEIDFVGADGRRQRLGRPSNPIALPPSGPSDVVDDRFVAFPWELRAGWHLEGRPAPGTARREPSASPSRGAGPLGSSLAFGGRLSGRPLGSGAPRSR